MTTQDRVFVGIPTYDEWMHCNTAVGLIHAGKRYSLMIKIVGSSALPFAFNQLWCSGVLSGSKYFAMIHADVGPDAYWVDTLVDELEKHDADIMSAVIPIKDHSNCYSVAMCHDGQAAHYRLTADDIVKLPETFSTDDMREVTGQDGWMCANTGLWVCRMDRPWVRFPGFQFITGIDWEQEKPVCNFIPEDWDLSQVLHRGGYKVMCTSKVRCTHAGNHVWISRPA